MDNETELKENDILQFGSSHFIIRKTIPIIIDLTNAEDDYDNQVDFIPHDYISSGVSPNNTPYYDRREDITPATTPYYDSGEDIIPNLTSYFNTNERLTLALAAQHPDWD